MTFSESDLAKLDNAVDIATTKLDRRKTDQGWHLKKEVNLTVIISVIVLAVSLVTGYTDLKKDIELIKQEQSALRDTDRETRETLREIVLRFGSQIEKIDGKLDRLIEKVHP